MPIATAADGCRIHYERTGTGPAVALIPGLGGDGRFWSGVAARLADRFDLIVMDTSLAHARETVAGWAEQYNAERPHSSLGYETPAAYTVGLRLAASGQLQQSLMIATTHAGLWSPLDERLGSRHASSIVYGTHASCMPSAKHTEHGALIRTAPLGKFDFKLRHYPTG